MRQNELQALSTANIQYETRVNNNDLQDMSQIEDATSKLVSPFSRPSPEYSDVIVEELPET